MSRFLLLVVAALTAAACQAPITAQHDRDARVPFESYATFAWITERPMIQPQLGALGQNTLMSPFLDRDVRDAVERNLAAKGYRRVRDPRQADLVVAFGVAERDRIQSQPASGPLGFRLNASDVRTYTEGALVITFFDPATRRPIWHGWATGKLPSRREASQRNEMVRRAADAILAQFPQRTTS